MAESTQPPATPGPMLDVIENEAGKESDSNTAPESFIGFSIKYSGSALSLRLSEGETVSDLKAVLFSMTDVPPESQKLLGLVKGRQPIDDTLLGQIPYAPAALRKRVQPALPASSSSLDISLTSASNSGSAEAPCRLQVSFTLLGTPESDRFKDQATSALLAGDLSDANKDIDYLDPVQATEKVEPSKDPKNLAKLEKVLERFSDFSVINTPRPGKRLLVLDLDYTIADTKRLLDPLSLASEAARPRLHEFLTAVWPHYDICIWSQTSWRWLEVKLIELNMLSNESYNISFVLDRTPMFSIKTKDRKHEVKPLELIWRRWPGIYGPHNTIHIDDLSRNFAMNPLNGLKIKPYKNSPTFDTELPALQRYLLQLTHNSVRDFTELNHSRWKHYQGPDPGA